ncbi:MAG TPA: DUF1080 domain-containing protein [Cyclobacteriaceae bacterium]|nr:DUF1080 domain-containing protein [Cyclobacteriaceae bacterium]
MRYRNFAIVLLCILASASYSQSAWKEIFNGKDLTGWKQLGGTAKYLVDKGILVGEAVPNSPNSFLVTEQDYSDFILEFDIYLDTEINSGVQIRSHSRKDFQNGRVHGYQVEVDPSSRAFSGGIYDEANRLWLYPISRNPSASKAYRQAQWNTYHIEAIGNEINTWINGVHCARLVDDLTPSGFIGLQVHSIGDDKLKGAKIKWRNIRILTGNFEGATWKRNPEVPEVSFLVNQLTELEKRKGWRLLWDGKTSTGWRSARSEKFPSSGWSMNDGALTVQATTGGESSGPGDIITTEQFADFELELEFRITSGANSGIKYFVDPDLNKSVGSAIGCEFQILDDEKHPDAKLGVMGNRTIGSLYDLIAAENISVPGRAKQFKGIGQWNQARIVSKNGKVEHWLNNEKVVEYDRFSQMFKALVNYSKYQKWENFGRWSQGHILLQDHGNEVSFRNIKIREL